MCHAPGRGTGVEGLRVCVRDNTIATIANLSWVLGVNIMPKVLEVDGTWSGKRGGGIDRSLARYHYKWCQTTNTKSPQITQTTQKRTKAHKTAQNSTKIHKISAKSKQNQTKSKESTQNHSKTNTKLHKTTENQTKITRNHTKSRNIERTHTQYHE